MAKHLHKPKASRAVANAVAQNPISYLIPCHRVIRSTGAFGGYGGGTARKKALHARVNPPALRPREVVALYFI